MRKEEVGRGGHHPHPINICPLRKRQQRRSAADHANGYMTAENQRREDASSSTADLLMPLGRTRVGFWNVRTLFQSERLAQAIREVSIC